MGCVLANVIGPASAKDERHPLAEHPIEFVDEQIDRRVSVIRRHGGREVWPGNFDATLRSEDAGASAKIAFDIDTLTQDARFMAKEPFRFGFQRGFHRVSEPQMDAAQNELGTMVGYEAWFHVSLLLVVARAGGLRTRNIFVIGCALKDGARTD